ncbi:hypothetical protein ES288_A06G072200v1 [Gossypium darwinii]|uniref:Uncharacterized protein n=1 Tax=Gossypium darwinii TaxID=34276 RepID=A0A5D2G3A1_GOSDA|nr:hypothetical protein ES288_A06G072200v1 [Gossypium darwinii]
MKVIGILLSSMFGFWCMSSYRCLNASITFYTASCNIPSYSVVDVMRNLLHLPIRHLQILKSARLNLLFAIYVLFRYLFYVYIFFSN